MSDDYPVLPFGGRTRPNSGHAGSETSQARATREDSDGTTSVRQRDTMRALRRVGSRGLTWRELSIYSDAALSLDLHHGEASGSLSGLHKKGKIARLTDVRSGCKVYVLPENVVGRETEPYGETAKTAVVRLLHQTLLLMVEAHDCGHSPYTYAACPTCEARVVLKRYESMTGGET